MKQILKKCLFILLVITLYIVITCLFIISVLFIVSFFDKTDEEYHFNDIKNKTNVVFNSCKIIKEKDTHGGFLGDGEKTVVYKCNKQINIDSMKDKWRKLPLSENLSVFMYGGIDKNGVQHIKEKSEYQIPKINDGYYYFIDDYVKSYKDINDIYSDKKLFDRYSYNFTLTIYDMEKNYLYYYEIDT